MQKVLAIQGVQDLQASIGILLGAKDIVQGILLSSTGFGAIYPMCNFAARLEETPSAMRAAGGAAAKYQLLIQNLEA